MEHGIYFTPVVPNSNERTGKPLSSVEHGIYFTPVVPNSNERPMKPLSSVEHGDFHYCGGPLKLCSKELSSLNAFGTRDSAPLEC